MSTQFTEDPIDTMTQWAAALASGCCCELAECPLPLKECESIFAEAGIHGYLPSAGWTPGDPYYQRRINTYSGADPFVITFEYDLRYVLEVGGDRVSGDPVQTTTDNGGTSFDLPIDTSFELPITVAEVAASAAADVAAQLDFDSPSQTKGSLCESLFFSDPLLVPGGAWNAYRSRTIRYRWRVPDAHLGTYFKITWDILDEPTVGAPSVAAGGEWIWTGPGDPGDAATWLSGWYDLLPPSVAGTRRVVNAKAWHLSTSPFGIRPTLIGEQYP